MKKLFSFLLLCTLFISCSSNVLAIDSYDKKGSPIIIITYPEEIEKELFKNLKPEQIDKACEELSMNIYSQYKTSKNKNLRTYKISQLIEPKNNNGLNFKNMNIEYISDGKSVYLNKIQFRDVATRGSGIAHLERSLIRVVIKPEMIYGDRVGKYRFTFYGIKNHKTHKAWFNADPDVKRISGSNFLKDLKVRRSDNNHLALITFGTSGYMYKGFAYKLTYYSGFYQIWES